VVSLTPDCFTPGVRAPGTHWTEGWVDPRASLDTVAKRKSPIMAPAGKLILAATKLLQLYNIDSHKKYD